MNEHVKQWIDGVSIGITVTAVLGALPAIAAIVSIVWGLIRIWETRTIQRLLLRWCPKR